MSADILSDVLRAVRLSGAIFFDIHAASPWVTEAPSSRELMPLVLPGAQHLIEYHVLVSGTGWANLCDGSVDPVRLVPGSVVVFPHGDPHVMSSAPSMRALPDLEKFRTPSTENPLPFRLRVGGDGPAHVQIICGFLGCDSRPFNPLIQALPRMFHLSSTSETDDGWLGHLIRATVKESAQQRMGSGGILSKLSELMFIEVVRRYAEGQGGDSRGWLAGLRDPHIGQAIRLLHGQPARAWSLADLAKEVGMSRTVLAERFAGHLGMPPIAYLQNWRMQMAAGMLADGSRTLAAVAETVGYESEAAFSRAFKRSTGIAPSSWRRKAGLMPKETDRRHTNNKL